ncbi:8-oxo-dGTP diphosphatase [Draconibacterium orientale]|uniref:8-oxo-dGTP diphosphatase n=1 Tax=Draconibacterium orientale TaxID=1168034 RepID=X5DJM1_9BACT|nr:NUDIX hydrolase [Draconibacterium orientale]AHW60747.1 NUDIX hydrolase [Draconibacterium orientale]SES71904.1 8-oxo-dGTP diphosphatase [Draconibacterium orientale]
MFTYKYPRAALTVDAIVFVKSETTISVLLIERGREPFKNKWALPGGFVDLDETLEKACIRELEEETGLQVEKMQQFRAYDAIDRDPRHRTISVVYSVQLAGKMPVKGNDDAAQARWFSIDDMPELAFDHADILNDFFGDQ